MDVLMIVNEAAYGSDVTFNALRLAVALAKRDDATLHLFLMGDGVGVAVRDQKTPDGYYQLDRMVAGVIRRGGEVLCCGTCLDARGIPDTLLVDRVRRSTMEELAGLTLASDKVLVF